MLITIWIPGIQNGFTREIQSLDELGPLVDEWGLERISKITITDIKPHYSEHEDIPLLAMLD